GLVEELLAVGAQFFCAAAAPVSWGFSDFLGDFGGVWSARSGSERGGGCLTCAYVVCAGWSGVVQFQ
ncbi:hypothetical protein AB0K74_20965, partial [Streptomyces sp. NPDC056159]|uniref:hypothetical protein n=1 Tax=Streptomyces sp. NPDC056159 TaxID=3155537 RepID=UPI003436E6CE